jgi:hypothetical protein
MLSAGPFSAPGEKRGYCNNALLLLQHLFSITSQAIFPHFCPYRNFAPPLSIVFGQKTNTSADTSLNGTLS